MLQLSKNQLYKALGVYINIIWIYNSFTNFATAAFWSAVSIRRVQ